MNLGADLEMEVLLRLRVKSLMRFKCVQRSWNNLIKSPYFVNRRSKLHILENPSLLIIEKSRLKLLTCEGGNEKPILIKSFPKYIERIESYGSCNGVFCLKVIYPDETWRNKLIAWNPTTNEVHHIPRAPSFCGKGFLYGFGAVNDDFKIVKLNINVTTKMLYPLVEVYNLSTKSWKIIYNCPLTMVPHQRPSRYNALVNGVYHWITRSPQYNNAPNILCFNFLNNKFQQLQAPNSHHSMPSYCDVIEIKGSLGYAMQYQNCLYMRLLELEIWVMDQNRWTKKYMIKPDMSIYHMCGLWNDCAEILGGKAGQLLKSYDHHRNKLRQFQIEIPELNHFWIYEFVPSMAPLSK